MRNNTVVYSGAAAAGGRAYYVGERGDGYVVTNNVAYFAPPLTGDVCFELDLAPSAYARIDSNACFGATFDRGATGLDPSPLTADPAFAAYPDDLRPGAGSPLRDSGTTASASATDLLGIDRGGSPDRGAYEGE